jgi:hypothetical protein
MKNRRISLLFDSLRYIHDISEFHLVQLIQFFLQPSISNDLREYFKSSSSEPFSFSHQEVVEIALNMVVKKHTSDMFLRPALEMLQGDEVVHLLGFLRNRICGTPLVSFERLSTSLPDLKYPSVTQAIVWLTGLLDVQLSAVLCSKECASFLLDLSVLIHEQVQATTELRAINGQIWNLLHRREGQPIKRNYSIEKFLI